MNYILYNPTDSTGFGNRIRGLVGAYALSLAVGRTLLVEDPVITLFFSAPVGSKWLVRDFFPDPKKLPGPVPMPFYLRPDNWKEAYWKALQEDDLSDYFPGEVWWWNESTSFYDALFLNPNYAKVWKASGIDQVSKVERIGKLTSYLLSNPVSEFLSYIEATKVDIGFRQGSVGIQFRSFADWEGQNLSVFQRFLEEVVAWIEKQRNRDFGFFVTTDSVACTEALVARLSYFGPVSCRIAEFSHTGTQRAKNRFLEKLKKTFGFSSDTPSWLKRGQVFSSQQWRRRADPYLEPLSEWYLLGECSAILSTFTSYAVFAGARSGNKADLHKIDIRSGFVGRPDHEDYLF